MSAVRNGLRWTATAGRGLCIREGKTRPEVAFHLAILAVAFALAGCQRDPLEKKVSAASASAFATWRSSIMSDSGADLRRRTEEALQEVRMKSAAGLLAGKSDKKGTVGVDAIDEAMRKQIDGLPLRDMLQLGYELRVQRLKTELAGLEDAMKENAQLVTKPGDLESKHHLEALRGRQMARVQKYRDDLAAAERELEPMKKASGKVMIEPVTDKPDEMPVRKAK
jgi:hypothetical protein